MRAAAAILLGVLGSGAVRAQPAPEEANPGFFARYIAMVERAQDGQPHWISPLITTTPRLNQRFRYDITGQSRPNDVDLTNYGNSKGVELILADRVAMTFGIPGYIVRDSPHGRQTGWADETFLAKYRFASANEENGNYVVSAFLGVSVPTGSDFTTAGQAIYTPTFAYGKGWGTRKEGFDIQTTVAVSIPGGDKAKLGVPVVWNTCLQGHLAEWFWPEFEVSLTHFTDGPSDGKWQAIGTAGVVLGRFPISGRLHVDFGAGYQFAMSTYRTYNHAWVTTFRLPF
ncbi:MAG TPA: hypothetical protein VKG23_09510 [Thermoanaerobaculia bacterium]|nr:hypothetical protein [Thermoanaerobaculia bacterium]